MITILVFVLSLGAQATDEPGACCTDDECIEIGAAGCEYLGGYFYGSGSDCGDPEVECEPVEDTGACRVEDACFDLLAGECEIYGGDFYGAGRDCSDPFIE